MLTERVRRLVERALQKGLEYSRRATHKWLSQGKEDALPDLPLVIRDNQGHFTADPQSVAEHFAKEWKREWRDEDTIGFNKEISSIRDLRDKHVAEAHEWARNLDFERSECPQSLSLLSVQDSDRPRPARIQRHRPTP